MAWDSAKPGDSEKIRSLGTVIRPNWESIEQGEDSNAMVNSNSGAYLQQYSIALIERNGRANNNDPTTESETFFLYCKTAASVAELYFKDPAGNVLQVTNGNKLGSTSTNFEMDSVSFDGTITYDEKMLPRAWGLIASGGNSFTIKKNFPGVGSSASPALAAYKVDITGLAPGGGNFADGDAYTVFATCASGPVNRSVVVSARAATSFTLSIVNDSGAGRTDVAISVMLMMN